MSAAKRRKTEAQDESKPRARPQCTNFGSGPCCKRPGYDVATALQAAPLGRSHRSAVGKERIGRAISETKRVLEIPASYRVGIVPGSDTGAFEMAMWSLLGPREVDVFFWESFGKGWMTDAVKQLPLGKDKGGKGVRVFGAEYGELPDLAAANPDNDILFTLNGTTSGVRVPNLDWLKADRAGLTLCDATSGAFALEVDWSKIDVFTFSWQKVLGGEGGHGMLVLSPRAVERLESYAPSWPLPKVFRLTSNGKLCEDVFVDSPINTPSMMCVEDYLDALRWVDECGGLRAVQESTRRNFREIEKFVEEHDWVEFLAKDPACRSPTSVCLSVTDMDSKQLKRMTRLLAEEEAAFDIDSYKDAPPGIRIWCGATVQQKDVAALVPWLVWAHDKVKRECSE